MNETRLILQSRESVYDVKLDAKQLLAAETAMMIYSQKQLTEFQEKQNKAVKIKAIKLFRALWKRDILLWLRYRSFKKACKHAQIEADTNGYKTYVVRSSEIAFVLMNALHIRHNKKIRVFGKNVDAIKLEETASFTATRKVHPPVIKRR